MDLINLLVFLVIESHNYKFKKSQIQAIFMNKLVVRQAHDKTRVKSGSGYKFISFSRDLESLVTKKAEVLLFL